MQEKIKKSKNVAALADQSKIKADPFDKKNKSQYNIVLLL